jgi:predicted choloylglycine hydrolase
VGCSQVAWTGPGGPHLIRNYDFSPKRWEALLLRSKWNKQAVLGMVDCLWGLLDGINQSGLCVSLAFGGDPKIGNGFAIPIIVRYVLETCATVHEAREALRQVPSFMAYNLTLLDKNGAHTTAFLTPGQVPKFSNARCVTNHQGEIKSKPYAVFTRTVERASYLNTRLSQASATSASILSDFLSPPLYAQSWSRGFGTLYTAAYDPRRLSLKLVWPEMQQDFDLRNFDEGTLDLHFNLHKAGKYHPLQSIIG